MNGCAIKNLTPVPYPRNIPYMEISKIIEVNGVNIRVSNDGGITRFNAIGQEIPKVFGSNSGNGYLQIVLGGKTYGTHRIIAMAFLEDYSDSLDVDHINGITHDNRPSNLRMVTNQQNQRGFTKRNRGVSEYRGVVRGNRPNRWKSHVRINGKQKTIGASFRCEVTAALAREVAAYNDGYPLEGLNFPYIFTVQPI